MPRHGVAKSRKAGSTKPRHRRDSDASLSLDLSSDGGYSGLDAVSDSDDNDDEIDAEEEKHIINGMLKTKTKHRRGANRSPRSSAGPTPASNAAASASNTLQSEEEDADEESDANKDNAGGDDDDDDDDDDSSSSSGSESDLGELDEATLLAIGVNPPNDGDVEDTNGEDLTSWNGVSESEANTKGKRQVRFAGVPSSDESSDDDDDAAPDSTFFPDIFVEQNALDPAFRREIENESDSSVSSSFWDYTNSFEPTDNNEADVDDFFASIMGEPLPPPPSPIVDLVATAAPSETTGAVELGAADATEAILDGYESDSEDMTTEDEAPPQPTHTHGRRGSARYVDSDDDYSSSDSDSAQITPQKRRMPRVRRYILTPQSRRPVAMINPSSGKMVIFTPEKRNQRNARADRAGSFSMNGAGMADLTDPAAAAELDAQITALLNGQDLLDPSAMGAANGASGANGAMQNSLMAQSGSVMMSAMISSQTFGDYVQSHNMNVGPIEAFFPANLGTNRFLGEDSDFDGNLFEDDGETNLRIEDFIQFDRSTGDGTDPMDALFNMSTTGPADKTSDEDFLLTLAADLQTAENTEHVASAPAATTGEQYIEDFFNGTVDNDMLFSSLFDTGLVDMNANAGHTPAVRRTSSALGANVASNDGSTPNEDDDDILAFMSVNGGGLEGIQEEDESGFDDVGGALGESEEPMPALLAHFDKNMDSVSAFRRNQIEKQLIYSNKATADSLAFSGPLNMGTLRGIRNGSLEAVTAPITPPRRPKQRMASMVSAQAQANRSPLELVAQKRKASSSGPAGAGASDSHKRQRSISEVKDLAL